MNRGLPVLDQARALDPCHRPEGSWALGTRMGQSVAFVARIGMENPSQATVLEHVYLVVNGFGHFPGFCTVTLLLKNRISVFWLMFLDLQVPRSKSKAWLAFEILIRISFSSSPLVDTLDSRKVK